MAEEEEFDVGSLRKELEWIESELRMSLGQVTASNEYCLKFCRVTEWHAGRWQVPLPLVQVLKSAICCFTKARPLLAPECEHIQYVLSRLALSCFEVLLYCREDDSSKEFWEGFLKTIQECHNVLQTDLNTEFDVLNRMSRNGGPWQSQVLMSILNQELVTQELVNEYLGSESPVFFEYRVKYLMKYKHIGEAMTLTKYCVNHPQTGTNKYFLHLFLTWLCRSSPEEILLQEIARIDCQEALDVICRLDSEGQVELAWILCVAFLTQQLRNGNMYCTRELILVWSKLQLKLDASKQHFLEKCRHLLLTSRNVNHIFLFIRVIQNEVGAEGLQFCVELCARALRIDYQDEPNTKTLVCKTLSYLLPNDLDFCRACTITVFFSECTLESFHAVENLYSQPDQLYTEDTSSVPSFLRCELLLVLKTTWPFDPEFWDWRILKKNCLALMRDKVALINARGCQLIVKHGDSLSSSGNTEIKTKEKPTKMLQLNPDAPRADGHVASMHRCVLCKKEFLGGHIVRHAQVHQQKGAFSCLICARKFRLRGQMLKHLRTHVRKLRKQELAAHTNAQESSSVTAGLQETCTLVNGILDNGNRSTTSESASVDEQSNCKTLTGAEDIKVNVADVPNEPHCSTGLDGAQNKNLKTQEDANQDVAPQANDDIVDQVTKEAFSSDAATVPTKKKMKNCVLTKQSFTGHKNNGALCRQEQVQDGSVSKDKAVNESESEGFLSCPGHGCSKVFTKIQFLTKHARKCHSSDENVQDYLMKWYKGKCRYCQRKFMYSQHLIDHLKRHQYPKLYFCLQCDCNQTFKSASELATHTKGHEAFQAQCSFRDCDKLFDELDMLYEHEAQHYLSSKPIRFTECDKRNFQTSKVLSHRAKASEDKCLKHEQNAVELLVPLWKSRKEFSEPKTYLHSMVSKQSGNQNGNGMLNDTVHASVESDQKTLVVESGSINCCINNEQIVNGHSTLKETLSESNTNPFYSGDVSSDRIADSDKTSLSADASGSGSTSVVLHNNVSKGVVREETATMSQNSSNLSQQSKVPSVLQSSSSQEQKSSSGREEHKTYGRPQKYYRPQPPSYLDERYISMPKRRKLATDSNHPPSSHANAVNVKNERHICRKCFMIFNSIETLEGHNTQDNCRPLFVMESDSD
ncbi:zinc finger protein 292-like isoform X1 [Carcharodon carcharias]|uniref:zinc finger protein 292-like isoform X1 n=2 Tax=Carcharodon carcharias TaxID=13397 RepID=UPI001B7DDF0A|nr:zinc finger protein 292-like isoform X1 [Carcharodon carcharias]